MDQEGRYERRAGSTAVEQGFERHDLCARGTRHATHSKRPDPHRPRLDCRLRKRAGADSGRRARHEQRRPRGGVGAGRSLCGCRRTCCISLGESSGGARREGVPDVRRTALGSRFRPATRWRGLRAAGTRISRRDAGLRRGRQRPWAIVIARAGEGSIDASGNCVFAAVGVSCHYHSGSEFMTSSTKAQTPGQGELHCIFPSSDPKSPRVLRRARDVQRPDARQADGAHDACRARGRSMQPRLAPATRAVHGLTLLRRRDAHESDRRARARRQERRPAGFSDLRAAARHRLCVARDHDAPHREQPRARRHRQARFRGHRSPRRRGEDAARDAHATRAIRRACNAHAARDVPALGDAHAPHNARDAHVPRDVPAGNAHAARDARIEVV